PESLDGVWSVNTEWVREIVELDCNEPAAADWIVLENNCATTGKKKYAKYATLYGCAYNNNYQDQNNYTIDWQCSIVGTG
ncbi:hypothetical protein, partial [Escherichia coli]|uniref:hypothetical protein n=1 Tax=Escherichia coli TaxID=562 RepID=UPI00215B5A76